MSVTVRLRWSDVPLLPGAAALAEQGCVTGASQRNWAGYGAQVSLDPALPAIARDLLSDPQTSGGLLVSCAPHAAERVLRVFREEGFAEAAAVGTVQAGAPGLRVDA